MYNLMPNNQLKLVCCVFSLLLIAGCSSKSGEVAEGRTKPRGRILENGLPIKIDTSKLPPGDPGLQVTFIKLGGVDAGTEYEAVVTDSANGAFELIGKDGKGIPPGKYRVVITLAPFGSEDMLKGRFSRERSKIEIEVKPGEDVVIDIAQYK
ncbi:MAG: carboxypeptidase-like regulatory domain-containing protein [Thermogemmata sp.]|nr:carboxypeptidase-like regulatory domain-containing protein [Thermogemmata sp.]